MDTTEECVNNEKKWSENESGEKNFPIFYI